MAGSSITRGRIRASWFDVTIAAGRIEGVVREDIELSPEMKERLRAKALALRAEARDILSMMTAPERADLEAATR